MTEKMENLSEKEERELNASLEESIKKDLEELRNFYMETGDENFADFEKLPEKLQKKLSEIRDRLYKNGREYYRHAQEMKINFPGDRSMSTIVRSWLESMFEIPELKNVPENPSKKIQQKLDMRLVVGEKLDNALEYGDKFNPGKQIELQARKEGNAIEVSIKDEGDKPINDILEQNLEEQIKRIQEKGETKKVKEAEEKNIDLDELQKMLEHGRGDMIVKGVSSPVFEKYYGSWKLKDGSVVTLPSESNYPRVDEKTMEKLLNNPQKLENYLKPYRKFIEKLRSEEQSMQKAGAQKIGTLLKMKIFPPEEKV